jgi:hypothetical protein
MAKPKVTWYEPRWAYAPKLWKQLNLILNRTRNGDRSNTVRHGVRCSVTEDRVGRWRGSSGGQNDTGRDEAVRISRKEVCPTRSTKRLATLDKRASEQQRLEFFRCRLVLPFQLC